MIEILGDVHAGKKFLNDVPLHRRGERETEVLAVLKDKLVNLPEGTLAHVQVGDLFDSFEVSNSVLLAVYDCYKMAAVANPYVKYFLYPGNHDRSRDADKVSSFEILQAMLYYEDNIEFVTEVRGDRVGELRIGFLPWDAFKTSDQLAQELVDSYGQMKHKFDMVFCHCDTHSFGEGKDNLVPTKILSAITSKVVTGHVHKPETFERDGVTVVGTGSMQPYAHGEEVTPTRYLTVSLDELSTLSDYKDKYIRLQLREGEVAPSTIPDCMGFKVTHKKTVEEEVQNLEVEFQEFNTRSLFLGCLREVNVQPLTMEKVMEKFDAAETGT